MAFLLRPFPSTTSHPFSNPIASTSAATPSMPAVFDFESYDAARSQAEFRALAAKQQQRREAEKAHLARQAAIQAEQDRLELEGYRAAARRVAEEEERRRAVVLKAEQERRRYAQEAYEAALLEQQQREVQRQLAARQQQEQRALALAEQRRRQLIAHEVQRQLATQEQQDTQHSCHCGNHSQTQQHPPTPPQKQETKQQTIDLAEFFQRVFLGHQFAAAATPAPEAKSSTPVASTSSAPAPAPATCSSDTPSSSDAITIPVCPTTTSLATPSAAEEKAAEVLQRKFRAHLLRKHQLSTLSSLSASLDTRKSTFSLPSRLEFTSSTSEPKVAFTKENKSFLAYEEFLVDLLSKADAVESAGDREVKKVRKALVKQIESELRVLDGKKEEDWRAFKAPVPVPDAEEKAVDAATADGAPTETTAAAATASPDSGDSSSSNATEDLIPAPVDSNSTPAPLTSKAVAELPSSPLPATLTRSRRSSTSETASVSTFGGSDLDAVVVDILAKAAKLGEDVAEAERQEQEQAQEVAEVDAKREEKVEAVDVEGKE